MTQDTDPTTFMKLGDLVRSVRRYWKYVLAITATGTSIGIGMVLALPSVYIADAVISFDRPAVAPRGGIGGLFTDARSGLQVPNFQISMAEWVLHSQVLSERVLHDTSIFERVRDTEFGRDTEVSMERIARRVRESMLRSLTVAGGDLLKIQIHSRSSELSYDLVLAYLSALKWFAYEQVSRDAVENQKKIENAISKSEDPRLSFRLQQLLAYEYERAIFVQPLTFRMIEDPYERKSRFSPDRKLLMIIVVLNSIGAGVLFAVFRYSGDIKNVHT